MPGKRDHEGYLQGIIKVVHINKVILTTIQCNGMLTSYIYAVEMKDIDF